MIRSFQHKGLRKLYEDDEGRLLPPDMVDRIADILGTLDTAKKLQDLSRPGLKLHPLKGPLDGFWSITVRANWRIIFRFNEEEGHAFELDFIDYH